MENRSPCHGERPGSLGIIERETALIPFLDYDHEALPVVVMLPDIYDINVRN